MDKLTAIRSFARPGFCPVKRARIFAARWYLVTMQNVERDPRCDYIGLGEGEYHELLPGSKARQARDARLNHCNGLSEWHGEVWYATFKPYNTGQPRESWHGSKADALAWVARDCDGMRLHWVTDLLCDADKYDAKADTGGSPLQTPAEYRTRARECRALAEKASLKPWGFRVELVRGIPAQDKATACRREA